jgi:phage gp16-like protein
MSRDARMSKLATIHIGRQRLGMAEDVYRDMLERISAQHGKPVRSAADCTEPQLNAVLRELDRLGFKPAASPKTRGKPKNFAQLPEYVTKIEALLAQLKAPWSYADAIARRMFGIERVAWCTNGAQLQKILAALDYEAKKQAQLAYYVQQCRAAGREPEAFATELRAPMNWRRNIRWLEKVGIPYAAHAAGQAAAERVA